ncbi:fimbrial protein [Gallibacterium anatis]|uniref:fimbrial protein n=1 Tax=Gallibacterium anatis TaxID=750 RepID=UPI000531D5B7|nr:fimbrial protein [Gallibacterium anatis]KGQ34912.1 fimbrial protein [Gallibacterium anatis]
MKKLLLTTLVVAGLGLSAQGAFADDSSAQHGTITINGKIVEVTCTINDGTPNISVTLPTISKTAFTGINDTKGDTSFEIKLTGCSKKGDGAFSDSEKIYAAFVNDPGKVDGNGRLLNTYTASGSDVAAKNVTVEIANNVKTNTDRIDISKQSTAQGSHAVKIDGTSPNGTAILQYKASYHAETEVNDITAGGVLAKVDYLIAYQ